VESKALTGDGGTAGAVLEELLSYLERLGEQWPRLPAFMEALSRALEGSEAVCFLLRQRFGVPLLVDFFLWEASPKALQSKAAAILHRQCTARSQLGSGTFTPDYTSLLGILGRLAALEGSHVVFEELSLAGEAATIGEAFYLKALQQQSSLKVVEELIAKQSAAIPGFCHQLAPVLMKAIAGSDAREAEALVDLIGGLLAIDDDQAVMRCAALLGGLPGAHHEPKVGLLQTVREARQSRPVWAASLLRRLPRMLTKAGPMAWAHMRSLPPAAESDASWLDWLYRALGRWRGYVPPEPPSPPSMPSAAPAALPTPSSAPPVATGVTAPSAPAEAIVRAAENPVVENPVVEPVVENPVVDPVEGVHATENPVHPPAVDEPLDAAGEANGSVGEGGDSQVEGGKAEAEESPHAARQCQELEIADAAYERTEARKSEALAASYGLGAEALAVLDGIASELDIRAARRQRRVLRALAKDGGLAGLVVLQAVERPRAVCSDEVVSQGEEELAFEVVNDSATAVRVVLTIQQAPKPSHGSFELPSDFDPAAGTPAVEVPPESSVEILRLRRSDPSRHSWGHWGWSWHCEAIQHKAPLLSSAPQSYGPPPPPPATAMASQGEASNNGGAISCPACTFDNEAHRTTCEICGTGLGQAATGDPWLPS